MPGYTARAGDFRRRIKFQQRVITPDPTTGAQVQTWVDLFTVWASIEPLSGRELIAAAAVQSSVTHTITIRYRTDLSPPSVGDNLRVVYGARTFNIHEAINESERNHVITIMAEEGLNVG